MDPVSVLTIVHVSSKLCSSIISGLHTFAQDFKNLENSTKALVDEIEVVRKTLVALTAILNDPKLKLAEISTGELGNRDIWAAIYGSAEDCQLYLEKLRSEVVKLGKRSEDGSFLKQTTRTVKLLFEKGNISDLRAHLHSRQIGLNTALHMLNVYISYRLPMETQERLEPQMALLFKTMVKLQASIEEQSSNRTRVPEGSSVQRLEASNPNRDQRLMNAAEIIHSNASTVSATNSTILGSSARSIGIGSEWEGKPSHVNRRKIEQWLSWTNDQEVREEDRKPDLTSLSAKRSTTSAENTSTTSSKAPRSDDIDSDAEGELEFEVIQGLLLKADVMFSQKRWADAEATYLHTFERVKALSLTRRAQLDLKQASLSRAQASLNLAQAHAKEDRFNESRDILTVLIQEHSRDEEHACIILDASYLLSQILLLSKDYDEAEKICKRTVLGRRRVLGKDDPASLEAIRLLIEIYTEKGDDQEASAWVEMLSPFEKPLNPALENAETPAPTEKAMSPVLLKDALAYLDRVKITFLEEPEIYNKYLDLMKSFRDQCFNTSDLIDHVSELFNGHEGLLRDFSLFLPPGYSIETVKNSIKFAKSTEAADSQSIKASSSSSGIGLHALFQAVQEVSNGESAAKESECYVTERRLERARSAGFDYALWLCEQGHDRPEIYKAFLELFQKYDRGISTDELVAQLAALFKDMPDIHRDFAQFLPEHAARSFVQSSVGHGGCEHRLSLAQFAELLHAYQQQCMPVEDLYSKLSQHFKATQDVQSPIPVSSEMESNDQGKKDDNTVEPRQIRGSRRVSFLRDLFSGGRNKGSKNALNR